MKTNLLLPCAVLLACASACSSTATSSAAPDTATTADVSSGADSLSDVPTAADSLADTTGPAPVNACEKFTACGGELEGKWTISGYCLTTPIPGPDLAKFPACAGSGITASSTVTGDATFSGGSLSWKWEAKTTYKLSMSDACAAAAGGASVGAQQVCDQRKLVKADATCTVTAGTCVCEWSEMDSQPFYSGQYTVAGNDLVYAVTNIHDPYCVTGNTLQYLNSYRNKQFTLTRFVEGTDAGSTPDVAQADAGSTPDVAAPVDVAEAKDTVAPVDVVATPDSAAATFDCDLLTKIGNCPLGPTAPPEAIAACKMGLASAKCHDVTVVGFGCLSSKEKCTADGKHDEAATQAMCKTEVDALKACLANP